MLFFLAKQGGATAPALWPFGQVSALLQGADCKSDHCHCHHQVGPFTTIGSLEGYPGCTLGTRGRSLGCPTQQHPLDYLGAHWGLFWSRRRRTDRGETIRESRQQITTFFLILWNFGFGARKERGEVCGPVWRAVSRWSGGGSCREGWPRKGEVHARVEQGRLV